MDLPCYITGTGLATVQGLDVETNWKNLLAGRVLHETGIVPLPRDESLPRVSQLAIHAAREALAAVGNPPLNDGRTALVVGTSKGPIEDWIDQLNGRRPPDITLGVARVAADLAAALGHAAGPRLTYAGACASGLHALIRAADLIQTGRCDTALVVAAEASTHALFQENFRRLGVLATPEEGCRPFDRRRRGFLLAEAAAAVWITRSPTENCIRIERGALLADATHLTGSDRSGNALKTLLLRLDASDVDLIHAHGTGTESNDASEFQAFRSVRSEQRVSLYSHKHAIGHTQGASGLIAVVINASMHRRSIRLGNSNSGHPIEPPGQSRITFDTQFQSIELDSSLVIAAGFGGTLAGLRLSRKMGGSSRAASSHSQQT